MNNNELDIIELFILDAIYRHGNVDDFILSNQLRCSRSFLLSKLECLWSKEYIVETSTGYMLSDKGSRARIPLTFYMHPLESSVMSLKSLESFAWTSLYVPPIGWNQ